VTTQVILWVFVKETLSRIFGSKIENVRGIRRNLKLSQFFLFAQCEVSEQANRELRWEEHEAYIE